MSRIRTIKPEFWASKSLMRVSRDCRLVFIGLWNFCDDFGVMLDHPKTIAGDLFPHDDDVDGQFIERCLNDLEGIGVIVRAARKGKDFIIIRGWKEHQKVQNPGKKRWLTNEEITESLMRVSKESGYRNEEGGIGKEDRGKNLITCKKEDLFDVPVSDLVSQVVEIWNHVTCQVTGAPRVRAITKAREALIKARAKDLECFDFTDPIAGFQALFAKIRASPFLSGKTNGFLASFDWSLKETNFTKIMEGNYEKSSNVKTT